jgi:hypothetical protein
VPRVPNGWCLECLRVGGWLAAAGCLDGEFTVRLNNHRRRFPQVGSRLFECGPLSVGSREFLDESDVTFRYPAENSG